MKVLLIYPTLGISHPDPPLGIAYIVSVLSENDVDVFIHDTSWDMNLDNTIDAIEEFKPDLVGISSSTINISNSFKIAFACKSVDEDIKICIGGPHPTVLPEETLQNKNVDFIVIGEGEITFLHLTRFLEGKMDVNKIKGIGYKKSLQCLQC